MGTGSGPRALPGHVGVRGADPAGGQGGRPAGRLYGAGAGEGAAAVFADLCALLALAIGMLGVGCAAVAAAILVYLWYIQMARREFGGLTGDLAGWFLQVCELGCLAAMVLAREIAEVLI